MSSNSIALRLSGMFTLVALLVFLLIGWALYQQVALKNFFTGANPYALEALMKNDAALSARVDDVEMLPPWRWNQGGRMLLMSGLRMYVKE